MFFLSMMIRIPEFIWFFEDSTFFPCTVDLKTRCRELEQKHGGHALESPRRETDSRKPARQPEPQKEVGETSKKYIET